jgi:Prolyl oligopeptidase family
MYNKALDFANKAIAVNGKSMGGFVYRAAANGKIALFKGIFSVASVVNAVRDDATKAIQLNNETPERLAAACYILGRAHLNLVKKPKLVRLPLGLGWGNIEDANAYLKRARQLRPNFVTFELEYARCLAEMELEKDAISLAQRIGSMPNKEPGDQQRKMEAVQLINDLK